MAMLVSSSDQIDLSNISADKIQTVSLANISKFFDNNSKYADRKPDVDMRIERAYTKEKFFYVHSRGGVINRITAAFILGGLAGEFFEEVAGSKEHLFLALQKINELDCSFK